MIENDTWLIKNAELLGLDPANVNPHSADIRLGRNIIQMGTGRPDRHWTLAEGEVFTFMPGLFYLCETLEHIHVPVTHRAQLHLKSSTARRGLNHLMAAYVDAGWSGVLTLEFVAYLPVVFREGQRVMQIEYARLFEPPAKPYSVTGRYHGATGVEKAKP